MTYSLALGALTLDSNEWLVFRLDFLIPAYSNINGLIEFKNFTMIKTLKLQFSSVLVYLSFVGFHCSSGFTHPHTLVGVIMSVIHDSHQSQPSLLSSGENLIGWQDEAVTAGVPQLEGVGVLDSLVVGPVNGATASLVYRREKQTWDVMVLLYNCWAVVMEMPLVSSKIY